MKIPCYNKGTKKKERNKNCSNITKGMKTNAQINAAENIRLMAVGTRRTKKRKGG